MALTMTLLSPTSSRTVRAAASNAAAVAASSPMPQSKARLSGASGWIDLDGFDESAQVARYGAERQGHFGWHADIGDGRLAGRRKLTMVVQLSDADAYRGGALEVMPSAHTVEASRERGSATLFPSFLLHRVTPVEEGARHSLTIWAHGPGFR